VKTITIVPWEDRVAVKRDNKVELLLDGKHAGYAERSTVQSECYRWHAVLTLDMSSNGHTCAIVQGHGPTPEDAVTDGFRAALADTSAYVAAVRARAAEMGVTL
jgi:hypothetical protein